MEIEEFISVNKLLSKTIDKTLRETESILLYHVDFDKDLNDSLHRDRIISDLKQINSKLLAIKTISLSLMENMKCENSL